jgi:hypothetical protein
MYTIKTGAVSDACLFYQESYALDYQQIVVFLLDKGEVECF